MAMLAAGTRAPSFRLKALRGGEARLEELIAERPVLLAFFKVSCPTCQYTFPFLDRLAQQDKIDFFGVSQDDAAATDSFNRRFGVSFRALLDEKRAGYPASNAFGITQVPSLFLVEPDGTIAWTDVGFSKRGLEELGARVGLAPFSANEAVPQFKAG